MGQAAIGRSYSLYGFERVLLQDVNQNGSIQGSFGQNAQQAPTSSAGDRDAQGKRKGGFLRSIVSVALTVAAILAASYLLRTFVFQSYEIPSASMEETIMTGDLLIGEKVSYRFGSPKAGQIVTFDDPEIPSRTLIKRVIATEGQTVDLRDGNVYIDGERQFESYTDGKPSYPLSNSKADISYPYTVPAGHVWVMGDNRTNSQDSRYFGAIPVSSVSARAALIYWPIDQFKLLE